jgi:hypothetical protein
MQSADERFSEESRKFLLDVKKGKSRKFVLVKDGVQIDRLIIFKRGTFDRVVRMARQDGAWGELFFGMLQGDGTDIRFELSRSDGFANPPGTEVRLKEFLREVTGLKFEPAYVIVDNRASADEADDDDEADRDADSSTAVESAVAETGSSVAPENTEDKFVRLLKAILPHVKQALAMPTSLTTEVQQAVREAQDFGRRRDFEPGMTALRRVGELTKQALAETEGRPATIEADSTANELATAQNSRRRKWEARLAKVEPTYRDAISRGASSADKLRKVMRYARNEARQQKFVKALVALDRLERLMGEYSPGAEGS